MKVFTVGLEQKPPLEEGGGEKKSDSPPPGYSTTEARIPLPIGPELPRAPLAPHPIIVRKSRGYKGILLVMLSVFLMAVFALVLSEMAYNRQRDENFFKLRWAELKHRMGYDNTEAGPLEYYQRATASIGDKFDRMLNLAKSNEMAMPIAAQSQSLPVEEESTASSSTSVPPPPTPAEQPIVAIDTFPMKPPMPSLVDSSASRSSSQASFEVEPPPLFGGGAGSIGGALGQFRDARLQFLRNILQKIKQHAEDIGFDGTMQVSIIEVEPQEGEQGNSNEAVSSPMQNSNGPAAMHQLPPILRQLIQQQAQQQQQIPPQQQQFPPMPLHFFPHPRPLIDDFKNSRSFLDGFGEFHQPSPNFMQNNQLGEQQPEEREPPARMMPWGGQQQQPMDFPPPPPPQMMMQQQQQNGPDFVNNMPPPIWPRMSQFPRQPEMLFFHPIFPQQMNLRFPPPPPPSIPEWAAQQQSQQPQQNAQFPAMGPLARPSAFDRWQQQPQPQQPQQQQGMMMAGDMGGAQQPAFQSQQPQQQQQQQQPSAQQIQIDFPEVKLPSPVVMGGDSAEDKFPVAPPNQQQAPQSPPQQQPQQKPDWLPKWLTENVPMMNNNGNNGATGGMDVMVGPPAQRPAEMVKFPSVTVLDSSSSGSNSASTEQPAAGKEEGGIVDNEESRQQTSDAGMEREETVPVAGNAGGGKVIDTARGETGRVMVDDDGAAPQQQPEEVIEVDAAPQQSEQPAQSSQPDVVQPAQSSNQQQQPEQSSSSSPNEQQQPQQAPVQMQKWFPEVPSVFFQVDDPTDQQQQQPAQQPQQQQQQPQVQPVGA